MPREIELQDGTVLEFPDDTPDDVIRQAIAARERSVGGFAANVLKSGWEAAKGIGSMAQTVGRAVTTLGLDPATGQLDPNIRNFAEQGLGGSLSTIGQHFKDRYGGVENIKNTAYTDPVGMGLDVAGLASGASGVARSASQGLQSAGRGLMRSALKVPEKVIATSPYAADDMTLAQTALDRGISRSTGGRRKLDRVLTPIGERKGELVRQSPLTYNPHDPVTTPNLRQHIQTAVQSDTVAPQFPGAGQQVLDDFMGGTKHNRPFTPIQQVSARTIHAGPQGLMPETQVPIASASADKVRIGQGLSDSAWATNPADQIPKATADAQRALYGDLAAQEARVPGVAALNQQLEPLYGLREYMVNTLGAPEGRVPYPSKGGAVATLGNTFLPYAESLAARGTYQAGRALAPFGQMGPAAAVLGGANTIEQGLQPELPSPPPPVDFQGIINAGDPVMQTFGPQPQGPEDDWWSPIPRVRP